MQEWAATRAEQGAAPGRPATAESDEWWMARMARADPRALQVLYRRYQRPAFGLARRICGNTILAEDAVQEAMLQLWRTAATFDPTRATVAAWVLTLVHRRSVDQVRRETTLRQHPAPASVLELERALQPDAAPAAEQSVVAAETREQIRAAIRELPQTHRHVLLLCYFAGYTQVETAAALRLPLGTVKSRCFHAIRQLRDMLTQMGFPEH